MPRTKMFALSAVLVLALHNFSVIAQTAPAASSPRLVPVQSDEVLVLRTQVTELQRFQEQVLATVYWSLGAVAGIAVLLVGFGWWTNFRVYERDKDSLERALRSQLSDAASNAREDQQKRISEQFSTIKQILDASAAAIETRLTGALTTHIDAAEKRLGSQVAQVKSSGIALGKRVRELELAAQLQERLDERQRKSFRNALQTSVTALEIANELGDDYSVGNTLDLVAEDIRTILAGNDLPIDNFLVGQLVEALNAVAGTHAHAAAALRVKASTLAAA